jgi:soluble lytic murein transglycosylase-like protein
MDRDPSATRRRFRFGFLVLHNKLWFSELLATASVGILLVLFMSVTACILVNSQRIKARDAQIALLKTETVGLAYAIETHRMEAKLLALLRQLSGSAVADSTLCRVATLVWRNSSQFGYDPLLLVAVIRVEGVFNPGALGRYRSGKTSGAMGLMQLKYETANEVALQLRMFDLSKEDLLNPEINLVLGVAYLTQLISRFKSFKLGLVAYNQGPRAVRQSLSNREPLSLDYYRKVLRSYYRLKKMATRMDAEPGVGGGG